MLDDDLSVLIEQTVRDEKSLAARLKSLKDDYPEIFAELDAISEAEQEVARRKADIKSRLVKKRDFDVHEENPAVRISVSKIPKIVASNLEAVPSEYLETKTVVNETKAIEYLRVMGTPPEGFIDKSSYRLNWKIKQPLDDRKDKV